MRRTAFSTVEGESMAKFGKRLWAATLPAILTAVLPWVCVFASHDYANGKRCARCGRDIRNDRGD
jgi:hypothetical protein